MSRRLGFSRPLTNGTYIGLFVVITLGVAAGVLLAMYVFFHALAQSIPAQNPIP